MKTSTLTSSILQWTLILPLVFWFLSGWSQQNIGRQTILQFDANSSVLKPDAPLLAESVPMEKGRNNALFVSGVGGVSFDQVAIPANKLKISNLNLNYNKKAEDGRRLELLINNKPVKVYLPDWMLVPIAKYAESPYFSCVTLFGKLKDKTLEKQVTDHKGRVINYHPAFDNTLIGIRLAYMDMLVGYEFTKDLPKNSNGIYILGGGEVRPEVQANNNGAYYLSQHIIRTENKYKLTFRSYVISDYSRQITFSLLQDSLVINGSPYYYCWKFNQDQQDYDINKVAKELSSKYNQKIKELSKTSASKAVQDWLIDKMISLAHKYNGNYGFYTEGTFVDMVKLKSVDEKKQFLGKYTTESLFDMIIKTEAYMDKDSVIYLKEFSDDVSSQPKLFEAANPAVWNATISTMRFAAFFRYVKINFPKTWLAFSNQVMLVDPEPRIVTPTIMYDPKIKVMEDAIKNSKKR